MRLKVTREWAKRLVRGAVRVSGRKHKQPTNRAPADEHEAVLGRGFGLPTPLCGPLTYAVLLAPNGFNISIFEPIVVAPNISAANCAVVNREFFIDLDVSNRDKAQ